jgi:hypothetical protein
MPKKSCPECNAEWGTRKKVCDCGHDFAAARHPLYPEPGAWVIDDTKGMPKIQPPQGLPDGLIETEELRDQIVAYEGLGFCIHGYVPVDRIKDRKLRTLWKKAKDAMIAVVACLEEA